ncbi:MAG: peroxiredoxin [Pseudomonadota bacterium]
MSGNLQDVDWTQIPAPSDDGAAAHLTGMTLPSIPLTATAGGTVDLSAIEGLTVVYIYPMTSTPGVALPDNWDMIPGARGCTPQSCAFRDHYAQLRDLGVDHLYGLSTQSTQDQAEAATRLHLPFPLLSDADLAFGTALNLPTFSADGKTLLKRLTLILQGGVIHDTIYPVFPADQNAEIVITRLRG